MADNPEAICPTCRGDRRCTDCDGHGCQNCAHMGLCVTCSGTGERP